MSKQQESDYIAKKTLDYINNGGKITVLPIGATSEQPNLPNEEDYEA